MLLVAAPYVACLVALTCVYLSWLHLARLLATVPLDLNTLAKHRIAPSALRTALIPETPLADLMRALASPHIERARAVNEALLEIGYALETSRRLPRVLASIGTSSCLFLAALILREILGSDEADQLLEQGIYTGAISAALSVALWGVFAAATCTAIYARSLKVERELSKSIDTYVEAQRF